MRIRLLQHRRGCVGNCLYCKYLIEQKNIKIEQENNLDCLFAWDEPNMLGY